MSKTFRTATVVALALMLPIGYAQAETADEFVARINREFADIWLEGNAAGWTQATYINYRHRVSQREGDRALARVLQQRGRGREAVREQQMSAGIEAHDRAAEARRPRAGAGRSGEARRARRASPRRWRASTALRKYCPQGPDSCQDEDQLTDRARRQPQLRRADRSVDGLALDARRRCAPNTSASSSSRTKARASWASRISARCGARVTTCRPRTSRRKPRGCTRR